jgi:hypothetical protein
MFIYVRMYIMCNMYNNYDITSQLDQLQIAGTILAHHYFIICCNLVLCLIVVSYVHSVCFNNDHVLIYCIG